MRNYYLLVKPGIVYGNAIPAIAAFLYASHRAGSITLFLAMLIGLSFVVAGSCVLNNIFDRHIDARMKRTEQRPLVSGTISVKNAYLFSSILLLAGFGLLFFCTTLAATFAAFLGAVVYVGFYTPLKHRTLHATAVGAIAGAMPPVVGYAAVTARFDSIALCLFLFLVCWQMVHFFAIAIYREGEYRAAGVPVMPVVIGTRPTKAAIFCYTLAFALAAYALYLTAVLGVFASATLSILSGGWIGFSIIGFTTTNAARWARGMFVYSLVALLLSCVVLALS